MSEKQKIAGQRCRDRRRAFYADVLPLIIQWTQEGVSQQDIAGTLNGMGRRNFFGFPYNQNLISRIMREVRLSTPPDPVEA